MIQHDEITKKTSLTIKMRKIHIVEGITTSTVKIFFYVIPLTINF
jgi:hypothetical protein